MRNQMDKMYEIERGVLLNSLIDGSRILKGVKSWTSSFQNSNNNKYNNDDNNGYHHDDNNNLGEVTIIFCEYSNC